MSGGLLEHDPGSRESHGWRSTGAALLCFGLLNAVIVGGSMAYPELGKSPLWSSLEYTVLLMDVCSVPVGLAVFLNNTRTK